MIPSPAPRPAPGGPVARGVGVEAGTGARAEVGVGIGAVAEVGVEAGGGVEIGAGAGADGAAGVDPSLARALDVVLAPGRGRVTHVRHEPARPGRGEPLPGWVDPGLRAALAARGIDRLWTHQALGAEHLHAGRHTVVATGTASGKSLAYLLPVLTDVAAGAADVSGRGATALYLAPTKALAADQAQRVTDLGVPGVRCATYDGDTPVDDRAAVRRHASYVLTNPDMLHHGILPGHERWAPFLRTLRYVVVDECHTYRGVFGAHAAALLRRLRRVCARYGATPTFALASATVARPGESAAALVGAPVEVVDDDGSPHGATTYVLLDPHDDAPDDTPDDAPRGSVVGVGEGTVGAATVGSGAVGSGAVTARAIVAGAGETATDAAETDGNEADGADGTRGFRGVGGEGRGGAGPRGDAGDRGNAGGDRAGRRGDADGRADAGHRDTGRGGTGRAVTGYRGDTGDRGHTGERDDAAPRPGTLTQAARLLADLARAGVRGGDTDTDAEGGAPGAPLVAEARRGTDRAPGRVATTAVFARSRVGVEVIADRARRELADDPALAARVAAYRGGYLPEDRRVLEDALRSGRLVGIATTSALELGIDVSGLDVVVLAGWPGTRTAFRQRAGRAGRRGTASLVVLLAGEDPLDAYLVAHPGRILDDEVEACVLDPDNPYVLSDHLVAAAAEIPLTPADASWFGPTTVPLLDALAARGRLRRRPTGWYWTGRGRPTDDIPLRGTGEIVRIVERDTGRVVGTVDAPRADVAVHRGAVYLHQQRPYVVTDLDLDDGAAQVVAGDPGWSTQARTVSAFDLLREEERREWGPVSLSFGRVAVRSQAVSFVRRAPSGAVLGEHPLDSPERTLYTKGVWWTVTPEAAAEAGVRPAALPGAAHAAEHAAIGLLPLVAAADRWDIGGVSTALHPDTGLPTVLVYDGHPGGAGFAERGHALARAWWSATRATIGGCRCATGCPSCVQSPKCGNGNAPLDKAGALALLDLLLTHLPRTHP